MAPVMRGVGAETGGAMLIIVGVAFAIERFTAIDGVWRWLPLLVLYLTARDLRHPEPGQQRSSVPLLVAIWMQISAIGFLGFDFLNSWPLLIASIGLGLVIDGVVSAGRSGHRVPGGE